jgi:hypothetical protein
MREDETPLLNRHEQVLYGRLVRAFPGHIILAQAELSRLGLERSVAEGAAGGRHPGAARAGRRYSERRGFAGFGGGAAAIGERRSTHRSGAAARAVSGRLTVDSALP